MSNIRDIRLRIGNLVRLGNRLKDQVTGLGAPEEEETRKRATKEGIRLGIGVGVIALGTALAAVAMVYSLGVIILLLNLAVGRLWLSALIVVFGFLLLGGAAVAIGVELVKSSTKGLTSTADDVTGRLKAIGEEMKAEAEELQKAVTQDTNDVGKQALELLESAKKAAPVAAPAVAGTLILFRLARRRAKRRREDRAILRVIETYEKSRPDSPPRR